jgi:hypothetical protein
MLRPSEKLEIIKKLKNLGYNGYYGDIIAQIENTNKEEPRQYDLGGTLNTGMPTTPAPLSASIPKIKKGKNKTYADMGWFTDPEIWDDKSIKKYSKRDYLEGDMFIPSWGKKGKIKVSTEGGVGAGVLSEVPENFDVTKPPKTLRDAYHMALAAGAETDAEARVIAAQWAVESGGGRSKSAKKHYAYFGIKGDDFSMGTHEVRDGKLTSEKAGWEGYSSPLEGFKARVAFTKKAKGRYRKKGYGKDKSDLELANILSEAGYATSPTYAANLKMQLKKLDYDDNKSKKAKKAKKVVVGEDTMQRMPGGATPPMSLEDFEKTTIENYRDELYQEREKAYGGLIKTRAPQRYVGKAYQDRKHHAGFMEGDLNMYSMAKGGPLKLSPEGGPKAEEINNDYNADGMMKARFAYEEMHGNPAAKRMVSPTDNPYIFPSGERGTHYMGSYGNYAVPNIQDVNGRLEMTGPIANEEMRFETEEDARYFAKNYKNIAPAFQKAYGGPLSGSNSGKPKKDISSVGQSATDYFMSNAYLNASGDNVPYNSDMGEIIDLSLPQPEENNPMRFEPYVSRKKIKAIKN